MQSQPLSGTCPALVATSLMFAASVLWAADDQAQSNAPPGTTAASATVTGKDTLNPEAREFIERAAKGNIGEIVLGTKAQNNANRQDVREFGGQLIRDHTKAAQQLRPIAAAHGVQWPSEPTQEQQQLVAELSKIAADGFDVKFVAAMVEEHEKTISDFEMALGKVQDQQLRQFIEVTLPVLKKHLEHARAVTGVSPQVGR